MPYVRKGRVIPYNPDSHVRVKRNKSRAPKLRMANVSLTSLAKRMKGSGVTPTKVGKDAAAHDRDD